MAQKKKEERDTTFLKDVEAKEESSPVGKELMTLLGNLPVEVTEEELEQSFKEDIQDTMEGVIPQLPQIKILPGAVCLFEMPPDENGEIKTVSEIECVIADHHCCSAYWKKPFSETGGGVPPDCFSLDGTTGVDGSGVLIRCLTCPHNQYGSGKDGKGKACKNMKRLHVFLGDDPIPHRLNLSATSIKVADRFFTKLGSLARKGIAMRNRKIKLTLEKTKNKDGIPYSLIKFALGKPVEASHYWQIKTFIKLFRAQIRGQEIVQPESAEENGSTDLNPGELDK